MALSDKLSIIEDGVNDIKESVGLDETASLDTTVSKVAEVAQELINRGAYKVSSTEEMNAITDMQDGDYCVVEGTTEYVIPDEAVFTRYRYGGTQMVQDYKDHLFIFRSGNTPAKCARSTTSSIAELAIINDTYELNITQHPEFVWKFTEKNGGWRVGNIAGTHFLTTSGGITSNETLASNALGTTYYSNNAPISTHNDRTVIRVASNTLWNSNYSTQSQAASWSANTAWMVYSCLLQPASLKYQIYQYDAERNAWMDATSDVIYPLKNVVPTTSLQYVDPPAGYSGMQRVQVSGVTSAIDANIIPTNIRSNTTILGVTGNLIQATTYRTNNIAEMNALTNVENGQYCIVKQSDNTQYHFKRFTGNIDDIIAGYYDDFVFAWFAYHSDGNQWRIVESIDATTDYGTYNSGRQTEYIALNSDDTFSLSKSASSTLYRACRVKKFFNKTLFQWLDGKYMYGGGATTNEPTSSNVSHYMHIDDYTKNNDNTYKFYLYQGTNYPVYLYFYYYWFSGLKCVYPTETSGVSSSSYNFRIYYASNNETTDPYTIYQRQNNTWVDVTDEILTDITVKSTKETQILTPNSAHEYIYRGWNNITVEPPLTISKLVTPSASDQEITPTGQEVGFNKIIVSAVDSTIDQNIISSNIKDGVTILGVTGNFEGDSEELVEAQEIVDGILNGYNNEE